MSQEGGDREVKETVLCSEDVATLSPRNGKRSRDEKEELLVLAADQCTKARELDLMEESAPTVDNGNGRESQVTSGEHLIAQSGKRIKCDRDSLAENPNTLKNVVQEVTSEIEEDTQFHCNICSVKCTSVKDYDTHVAGKRHAKAVMGVTTPRSGKITKKTGTDFKAKVLSPPNTVEQKAIADGSITNLDQAGKGPLSSCTGCTDLEAAELQALKSPDLNDGKDVIVEQQDPKEGTFTEVLESQSLKNDSATNDALHDSDNGMFNQPLTNGTIDLASADGLAKCSNNTEGQPKRGIMDSTRCKSRSDCIERALAAAYQVCACPGLQGLLKSGTCDQAAGCTDSRGGGAVSSNSLGMVSMHAHCFMNLIHDVQVKVMEDLFRHVVREEGVRGFTPEAWLPNGAPVSVIPPSEKDLNCNVCRVEYGSKSDLDRHVAGKKHASCVTRLHSRCHLCNVNCNSEKDFEKHVNGKKHASKLRLVQKRVVF